jgi:hypothetical protein
MFKIILAFLFVFFVFYFGIQGVRSMTGRDQLALTKLLVYSIMCALMTVVSLIVIVVLF